MYKKLHDAKGKKNDDQVYLIKKVLNRLKEAIKNVSEDKKFIIEENKKLINILERILSSMFWSYLAQKSASTLFKT